MAQSKEVRSAIATELEARRTSQGNTNMEADDAGNTDNSAGAPFTNSALAGGVDLGTGELRDPIDGDAGDTGLTNEFAASSTGDISERGVASELDSFGGDGALRQQGKIKPAKILQNRNRANPASIKQMQSISANPDYTRLGFSRDFANGAPVVAGASGLSPERLGRTDNTVAADGRKIPVQYAVVEADEVLASNTADGLENVDYADQGVQAMRAIAGNGRIAGLQAAYTKGTTGGYKADLLNDDLHGIDRATIEGMNNPVLVRVMPDEAVTADIGDVSNTVGNLSMSPVEQANNDAQRINLDALTFAEDGSITPDTVRGFVVAMPESEQGGLVDTNKQPTRQAYDRVNAAIFAKAYENDELVRIYAQSNDEEAKSIMSALAQVAPKMARLEGAGALDIRDIVTQAAEIAVNARRAGITLEKAAAQRDLGADPDVGVVLDLFAKHKRSSKPIVEALTNAADFAYNEANKPAEDMFGTVEKATRSEVLARLQENQNANEQRSQEPMENSTGGGTIGQNVERATSEPAGASAPAKTQTGRPAKDAASADAGTSEPVVKAKAVMRNISGFSGNPAIVSKFDNDSELKADPDYKAAKSGDSKAAYRLVERLVTKQDIETARKTFSGDIEILLPVIAQEQAGANAIPLALANRYASELGVPITTKVVQTNEAFHTGANAMERLIARASFEGSLQAGKKYVVVDDVTTLGSTIADLASFVGEQGATVNGVLTLVNASRSKKLLPNKVFVGKIKSKYGEQIKNLFAIEPDALTYDEAQYLVGFKTADELRVRAVKAHSERAARLLSKDVSKRSGSIARRSTPPPSQTTEPEQAPPSEGFSVSGKYLAKYQHGIKSTDNSSTQPTPKELNAETWSSLSFDEKVVLLEAVGRKGASASKAAENQWDKLAPALKEKLLGEFAKGANKQRAGKDRQVWELTLEEHIRQSFGIKEPSKKQTVEIKAVWKDAVMEAFLGQRFTLNDAYELNAKQSRAELNAYGILEDAITNRGIDLPSIATLKEHYSDADRAAMFDATEKAFRAYVKNQPPLTAPIKSTPNPASTETWRLTLPDYARQQSFDPDAFRGLPSDISSVQAALMSKAASNARFKQRGIDKKLHSEAYAKIRQDWAGKIVSEFASGELELEQAYEQDVKQGSTDSNAMEVLREELSAKGIDLPPPFKLKAKFDDNERAKLFFDAQKKYRALTKKAEDAPLTAPTKSDILAKQERESNAANLDQREQIKRESAAGAGQFTLEAQDGRQDTTQPLFSNETKVKTPSNQASIRSAIEGIFSNLPRAWERISQSTKVVSREEAQKVIDGLRGKVPLASLTAWHGSPHRFDKFTTAAMGTGEGAQAYGWGLYFADSKDVAEHYRKTTSLANGVVKTEYTYDGKSIKNKNKEFKDAVRFLALSNGNKEKAIWNAKTSFEIKKLPEPVEVINIINAIDGDKAKSKDVAGQLYKVTLSPKESEYLLWDKPLIEQPKEVRAALESAYPEYFREEWIDKKDGSIIGESLRSVTPEQAAKVGYIRGVAANKTTAGDFYKTIAGEGLQNGRTPFRQQEASLALLKAGIRGIKFLDGTSRAKGEGQYNYVIFDEADVSIDETFYSMQASQAQAFYNPQDGKIYMIADNIEQGTEASVWLHEVFHKRGGELLGKENLDRLHKLAQGWKGRKEGSVERKIYDAAHKRATDAATGDVVDTVSFSKKSQDAYAETADKLQRAIESMGLVVTRNSSRISKSEYVEVESKEYTETGGEEGRVFKIRVSDHELPGRYAAPDFDVALNDADARGDIGGTRADAILYISRKTGAVPTGVYKKIVNDRSDFVKNKDADAKSKRDAVKAQFANQKKANDEYLQKAIDWANTLPSDAVFINSNKGNLSAKLNNGDIVLFGKAPFGRPDFNAMRGKSIKFSKSGGNANGTFNQATYQAEFLAYAIEEANNLGVKPNAKNAPLSASGWLAQVQDMFAKALKKLVKWGGADSDFKAQDLMAMAYGAAGLEYQTAGSDDLLNPYSRDEVLAKQEREEKQRKEELKKRAGEVVRERMERERKEVAQRSYAVADSFELGQSAEDSLAGQGALFSAKPFDGKEEAKTKLDPAQKTIMVDGVERPAHNSKGQPIHWSEEGTRNFWRWFGDSKVVDKEGRPLVVYHGGSKGTTQFKDGDSYRSGIFFTDDKDVAAAFGRGGDVYGVYLKAKNQFSANANEAYYANIKTPKAMRGWTSLDTVDTDLIGDWAFKKGYDGVVIRKVIEGRGGKVSDIYIVAKGAQIKSATGNTGDFDGANADIRFSLSPALTQQAVTGGINPHQRSALEAKARNTVSDLFKTHKGFNSWWHKTVGTQYHKAKINKHFATVYDKTQEYISSVSSIANDAADLAQDILPRMDSLKDVLKKTVSKEDNEAVGAAIFAGTLSDNKVYSDQELKTKFKLGEAQIKLYKQFRKSVDKSLDDLAKTDMLRYAGDYGREVRDQVMAAADAYKAGEILAEHIKAGRVEKNRKDWLMLSDMETTVRDKAEQVMNLKEKGYAPLMRFGKYSVYVTKPTADGGTEQVLFSLFEKESEANAFARKAREEFAGADVQQGVLSEEAHKLMQGVTPETLELFAESIQLEGVDNEDKKRAILDEYLKLTKSNHSAMKRMISRKGVAGFNQDVSRVLAAFITSNARMSARNLHMGDMAKAAADIPKEQGDVKDEAIKLVKYLQDPQEEAAGLRGLLFLQYIGGSIASAIVNTTQPMMMTFPYLSQFGGAKTLPKMLAAQKQAAMGRAKDPDTQAAMKRAEKEGIVSPQEIHQIQGEAMRNFGSNIWVRRATHAWGAFFSVAEQFNRRATFIAAYEIAKEQGMDNPYKFASEAINETQGVYNKGNRPDWARGAVGATIFTFKQYSISYVEFLKRLPPKQRVLALAMLALVAGVEGLPFMEDAEDAIDSIAQQFGYNWNSKREKEEFIVSVFGETAGGFVLRGVSEGLPIDLSGRMGMANLLPGTGVFLKHTTADQKVREALEPLGVAGSMATDLITGRGGVPIYHATAVKNLRKAMDMADTGVYRDTYGRTVVEVSGGDAFAKALGFQPSHVAKESDRYITYKQDEQLYKAAKTDITRQWAEGLFEKDPDKVQSARESLLEWNEKNPEARISNVMPSVLRRVKEMRTSREERTLKRAPKELRGYAREAMGENE